MNIINIGIITCIKICNEKKSKWLWFLDSIWAFSSPSDFERGAVLKLRNANFCFW